MLPAASILLKALIIALLGRVAWIDLTEQKIANRDVLLLLAIGFSALAVEWLHSGQLWNALAGFAAGAVIFFLLIPFWMIRKIGAGDVKLLAVCAR